MASDFFFVCVTLECKLTALNVHQCAGKMKYANNSESTHQWIEICIHTYTIWWNEIKNAKGHKTMPNLYEECCLVFNLAPTTMQVINCLSSSLSPFHSCVRSKIPKPLFFLLIWTFFSYFVCVFLKSHCSFKFPFLKKNRLNRIVLLLLLKWKRQKITLNSNVIESKKRVLKHFSIIQTNRNKLKFQNTII